MTATHLERPMTPAYADFMLTIRENAIGAGASDLQLALLDRAIQEGEISYELTIDAINNTFNCFESAGLHYSLQEPDDSVGFPRPNYQYGAGTSGLTDDQALRAADACMEQESSFVEMAYSMQPGHEELVNRIWDETKRPPTVACLEEHGVVVPDDATRYDIENAVLILLFDPVTEEPTGPNCAN